MHPQSKIAIPLLAMMVLLSLLAARNSLKFVSVDVLNVFGAANKPNKEITRNDLNITQASLAAFKTVSAAAQSSIERSENIPINSNSTIASDIAKIWHDPNDAAICIELKQNARCPHPAFRGRLSGPTLVILEWNEREDADGDGTVVCGSYKDGWLNPGKYFLDVIVLFCHNFGLHSLKKHNASEWLSYDFKSDCMEDPTANRITGEASYVSIDNSHRRTGIIPRGRWIPTTTLTSNPLYTRYQPKHCRRVPQLPRCAESMNDAALNAHSFQWFNNSDQVWKQKIDALQKLKVGLPKVCIVGFSHSRHLVSSFNKLGLGKYVVHAKARYPYDVGAFLLNHSYVKHGCTQFIIGVAQWPGSMMQGYPYLFDQYLNEMRRIVDDATKVLPDEADAKVYMRSIHHIPIGDVTGSCPITDWRSPIVMDGYSHLIEQAVTEANDDRVQYLDTTFVTSPMWDSAFDWVHLPPQVSDVEALYMAAKIFHLV